MCNKAKAIVLGGTVPHIELIKQLQERGYYVILVDYLENPVAKPFADEHIIESTLDKDAVLTVAIQNDVELVIASSVDQANITACYVMEKLGKRPPYSYEIAERITNKGDMKRVMWENNVPTSKYVYIESEDEYSDDLGLKYPVIVKPANSTSSKGVKKANNYEEAIKYIKEASVLSSNNNVIVEEYVVGVEASVYCYIDDIEAHILLISQRISRVDGEEKSIKCYATVSNVEIKDNIKQRIKWSVDKIAKAYGLKSTPFFIQIFITEDDISVIEFAPRTGGGTCFRTVREATNFNYIGSAIDSYLGINTPCKLEQSPYIYAVNILYCNDGIFDRIEGLQLLIDDEVIDGCYVYKTKGMQLKNIMASTGRVAVMFIKGKTKEDICNRVSMAIDGLSVFDVEGKQILRKDIYLCEEDIK